VLADFSAYPKTDSQAFNQPALHLESATFAPGAPAYTIELYAATDSQIYQANITFDGAGVANSSGVTQNFVIDPGSLHGEPNGQYIGGGAGGLTFNNSASAGSNVTYYAQGGFTTYENGSASFIFLSTPGSAISFNNTASADNGTFIVDGGARNGGPGAQVEFHNTSSRRVRNLYQQCRPARCQRTGTVTRR